jgi:hypothetical protein
MSTFECCICYEDVNIKKLYLTICVHKFCNECFSNWKQTCKNLSCPVCRTSLIEEKQPIDIIEWQKENLNTFSQDFYFRYIQDNNENEDLPTDEMTDFEPEENEDWDEIQEWQRTNYYGEEYV